MTIHEKTLQGLTEALAYVKGDKSMGRSFYVDLPDDEVAQAQILWLKILNLPNGNRQQAMKYIDGLLQAAAN